MNAVSNHFALTIELFAENKAIIWIIYWIQFDVGFQSVI